jgi:DNA polymerase I
MNAITPKKTLYLIDGSSYIYRAFYALGRLTNSRGVPTQAIYGFSQMLLKVMREQKPDYLCVVFDPPGPTHRNEMFAAYKATRQKMPEDLVTQVPYIKDLVRYHGVAQMEKEGYEADDVIATLTCWAAEHDLEVVIVSGDKDLLQLVSDPRVRQWDPQKDRVFTEEGVAERFGVTPEQMVDYLALMGDSTDNIPGVKGVGEKTAKQLLQTWKSLDALFEHVDEISPASLKAKLLSDRNSAYLSRDLVSLKSDVPVAPNLEEFRLKSPQKYELIKLYGKLNFKSLLEALRQEWGAIEEPAPSGPPAVALEMRFIQDQKAFAEFVKVLEGKREFALHLDSSASDPMRARIRGVAISFEDHIVYYVPFPQPDESGQTRLSDQYVLNTLGSLLGRSEIAKIGHNLKSDWIVLKKHGMQLDGSAFDTMVASYLLDPGQHAHDLERLAGEHLGENLSQPTEVRNQESEDRSEKAEERSQERGGRSQEGASVRPPGVRQSAICKEPSAKSQELPAKSQELTAKSQEPRALVPPGVGSAGKAAEVIWRLAAMLKGKLLEADQEQLFLSLELPLIAILARMEYRGILVDAGRLEALAVDFEKAMSQKAAKIFELAKEDFNIQSPKQLAYILFEKLGLPVIKKTKSGPSTDSSVLDELIVSHPIVELILSYRSLAKLKGTYAEVLPRLIHPETRRIHTFFNQTVTATGRLSSSEPNLQNIPIRSEEGRKIREAFIPSPGHVLLSADYSQIELRILAHFSKDEHLLEAFHSDGDVHRQTAAEMYNIPQHEVTPEMRRQAKTINFGIIYGMGAFGLARRLGISRQMAKGVIDRYFERYQGVRRYIDTVVESARRLGYTETLLGRRRPIPELSSRNHNIRQQGERLAVNSPIQGSAADLIKKAMIDVDRALRKHRLAAVMLLQVHDELVFEVPKEELEAAKELVLQQMEQVWDLSAPLEVALGWGENWAQAHS